MTSFERYLDEIYFLNCFSCSSIYCAVKVLEPFVKLCLSLSLSAYLRVFKVWSLELLPGQIQASIIILTFSPYKNESLKTIVNLDALKGTC